MEYKTIQELYLSLGVAGAIIVVFLGVFVYVVVQNDKRRSDELSKVIEKLGELEIYHTKFQTAVASLSDAVKELSVTNRVVADTVSKLDYYNKDFSRKLEKHDEKSDKILDIVRG